MNFFKAIFDFINKNFKTLIFIIILAIIFLPTKQIVPPNLQILNIKGPIFDDSDFIKQSQEAFNKNIKGVLVVIDSPGGSVAPSVEMSLIIKRLKKQKPVIVYAKGMMASGGYYAGIWANKIIANPGSLIGSIGVIFQSANIKEFINKIGIKEQSIKMGKYKEVGTIFREWKDYEKKEMQKVLKDTYNMFVSDVAKARNLDIKDAPIFADAHIFTANEALKVGLIDKIGSLYDAKTELIKLAKVKKAIWYKKDDKIEKLLDKIASKISFYIFSYFGMKFL